MPRPAKCWGCKGRSPLHEITLVSPFPAGEGGWGDRGQQRKLTAGAAGDQKGKPPLRTPQRQGQPATPGGKPSPGACFSGSACAASGLMPGVPGAVAPGKIILESPPSPPGKGAGGIGGKKANQRQGRQATKKASHPCEHHSGRVNRQRRGQAPAGCGRRPSPAPPGFSRRTPV